MNKGIIGLLAAGTLATGLALAALTTAAEFDRLASRYPGSARVDQQGVDLALKQKFLSRQAEYRTGDDFQAVARWYAEALAIDPGSDGNLLMSGECAWITQGKPTWLLNHAISVLACATPAGTSIVVNEEFYLGP